MRYKPPDIYEKRNKISFLLFPAVLILMSQRSTLEKKLRAAENL